MSSRPPPARVKGCPSELVLESWRERHPFPSVPTPWLFSLLLSSLLSPGRFVVVRLTLPAPGPALCRRCPAGFLPAPILPGATRSLVAPHSGFYPVARRLRIAAGHFYLEVCASTGRAAMDRLACATASYPCSYSCWCGQILACLRTVLALCCCFCIHLGLQKG